jgi:hypothetical protein
VPEEEKDVLKHVEIKSLAEIIGQTNVGLEENIIKL